MIIKRTSTILATVAATMLIFTGCAGGGPGGEFYGEYKCSTSRPCQDSGNLVRLTLDGDDVTFDTVLCDGEVSEDDHSVGVLNDAQNSVAWTLEGKYEGNDPFTSSTDGEVVTLSETAYSKDGTDAADALLEEKEQRCAD